MKTHLQYRPKTTHQDLGNAFFDAVEPADFPQTKMRFRNDRIAKTIGLETLNDEKWIEHFGHFKPLEGSLTQALALRYHGHQFRSYNPQLGDGRGFLFAQLEELKTGRLLDLGTKGSGQTHGLVVVMAGLRSKAVSAKSWRQNCSKPSVSTLPKLLA